MDDLILETSLTPDEIAENFKNFNWEAAMQATLDEIDAYQRGEEVPGMVIHDRTLPDVDTVEIRKSLSLTQPAFAAVLGVPCGTVEAWESGQSNPPPTARKLLYLIQEDHSLVQKLQQIG